MWRSVKMTFLNALRNFIGVFGRRATPLYISPWQCNNRLCPSAVLSELGWSAKKKLSREFKTYVIFCTVVHCGRYPLLVIPWTRRRFPWRLNLFNFFQVFAYKLRCPRFPDEGTYCGFHPKVERISSVDGEWV